MCQYCEHYGTRMNYERGIERGNWAIYDHGNGRGPYMNIVDIPANVVNVPINNCPACGRDLSVKGGAE